MKKLLYLLAIVTFIVSCSGPDKHEANLDYTVKGTINKEMDAMVFIKNRQDGKWITIDSTDMVKGVFDFAGQVVIATGKAACKNARPTRAGLKIFWPRPP